MKRIIILMLAILLVLPIINADMTMFNQVIKDDTNQIVRYFGSYYFLSNNEPSIFSSKNKEIPMSFLVNVQSLPYNLTYGTVDYCNLTVIHYVNHYDFTGDLINSTTESFNYFYNSGSYSQLVYLNVKDSEYVQTFMDCHYTNINDMFTDNILVGRYDTLIPSFECVGCTKYTLEQLTNEVDKGDTITENQLGIFSLVNRVIELNFRVWLILNWVLKIGLLGLAIGLVFYGFYYYYKIFSDMSRL